MAFTENTLRYNELIRLTQNGIQIASFYQIQDAFSKLWKEIYGDDIDLSTGTIDNQCIMHFSLIYFNLLQTVKGMSTNFDTSSANSKYLDIMYNLTNFKRESATHSTCYCYAQYSGDSTEKYGKISFDDGGTYQYISFYDNSGNKWTWKEYQTLSDIESTATVSSNSDENSVKRFDNKFLTDFADNEIHILKFECESDGEINLLASPNIDKDDLENSLNIYTHGDILSYEDTSNEIELWIYENASPGTNEESDIDFRSRKLLETKESKQNPIMLLKYELESIKGIEDVMIYCYGTPNSESSSYNVTNGEIYIVLKYEENVVLNEYEIAKSIYDNLTPGILTKEPSNNSKKVSINIYNNVLKQDIFWKKAIVQDLPTSQIYFMYESDIYIKSDKETIIKNAIITYFDNLKFTDTPTISDLISFINESDVIIDNRNTFVAYKGDFNSTSESNKSQYLVNNDSYFDISDYIFDFNYVNEPSFGEKTKNAYVEIKKRTSQGA